MKLVLVAVNAKYVHSNLAVYCLKSYAAWKGYELEIAEYTINQQPSAVLRDLYARKADVAAFSCYIWNISYIGALIRDYKKVSPKTELWLGGPEVSYRAEELLVDFPEVRGVVIGEGEETIAKLAAFYTEKGNDAGEMPEHIPGIVYQTPERTIRITEPALPLDFSRLPFPYAAEEEKTFKNRIIYYESSRGCPYSCAYCLSSVEKRVRFRDMDLVKKELRYFIDRKVPQVKFIDRTFNANAKRTTELLRFLKETDNGVTNFHFEIAAELLTSEEILLLNGLRPGLVQLEIGVQSVNGETLAAVHRKTDLEKLKETVFKVRKPGNVHIHLDLIAGLPKEDMASFRTSFNEVYRMRPHQLQLGFLKVLSGSPMEKMTEENGILYQSRPPYEVLATNCLSYEDITELKRVEEMVEVYYNSGQFLFTIKYLEHMFEEPYELYRELADYYEEEGVSDQKISRGKRYELLLSFAKTWAGKSKKTLETAVLEQILFYDYCLREKVKGRPAFGVHSHMDKQELKVAYEMFGIRREEEGMHGVEKFAFSPQETAENGVPTGEECLILFQYERREPIYGQALVKCREKNNDKG